MKRFILLGILFSVIVAFTGVEQKSYKNFLHDGSSSIITFNCSHGKIISSAGAIIKRLLFHNRESE